MDAGEPMAADLKSLDFSWHLELLVGTERKQSANRR